MNDLIHHSALAPVHDISSLVELSLSGLSPRTAESYRARIREFLSRSKPLTAHSINIWIQYHLDANRDKRINGIEASNQRLAAIKKFAKVCYNTGLLAHDIYIPIYNLRGRKRRRIEARRWLTQAQFTALTNDLWQLDTKPKDLRDGAIIALALGCGLRRAEIARARMGNLQVRESRWCIVDLLTKGGKVRTMGIPTWAWNFLDRWLAVGVDRKDKNALLFPRLDGKDNGQPMTGKALANIVKEMGCLIDMDDLHPHDLRRTHAQLALRNGANIAMVQQSLGHSALTTTAKYLSTMVDMSVGEQAGDYVKSK